MTKTDDELAALRKRVEELEAKAKPPEPEKPFVPPPYQQYDPTAGMCMPPSALREMAGHPCNQVMAGVIQDRHAPTGRPGMIPDSGGPRPSVGSGTGWSPEVPLSNPPGTNWVDAQLIADEVRQRAELKRKMGE
jgi:hypothetical protein